MIDLRLAGRGPDTPQELVSVMFPDGHLGSCMEPHHWGTCPFGQTNFHRLVIALVLSVASSPSPTSFLSIHLVALMILNTKVTNRMSMQRGS